MGSLLPSRSTCSACVAGKMKPPLITQYVQYQKGSKRSAPMLFRSHVQFNVQFVIVGHPVIDAQSSDDMASNVDSLTHDGISSCLHVPAASIYVLSSKWVLNFFLMCH